MSAGLLEKPPLDLAKNMNRELSDLPRALQPRHVLVQFVTVGTWVPAGAWSGQERGSALGRAQGGAGPPVCPPKGRGAHRGGLRAPSISLPAAWTTGAASGPAPRGHLESSLAGRDCSSEKPRLSHSSPLTPHMCAQLICSPWPAPLPWRTAGTVCPGPSPVWRRPLLGSMLTLHLRGVMAPSELRP